MLLQCAWVGWLTRGARRCLVRVVAACCLAPLLRGRQLLLLLPLAFGDLLPRRSTRNTNSGREFDAALAVHARAVRRLTHAVDAQRSSAATRARARVPGLAKVEIKYDTAMTQIDPNCGKFSSAIRDSCVRVLSCARSQSPATRSLCDRSGRAQFVLQPKSVGHGARVLCCAALCCAVLCSVASPTRARARARMQIPTQLGLMQSLTGLGIVGSPIVGTVPDELALGLQNLDWIEVCESNVTGHISDVWAQLVSTRWLRRRLRRVCA